MAHRTCFAISLTACLLSWLPTPASAEWRHPHGDSANTSFARVDTLPARRPLITQPLGMMAPGANPVVGNDGTVYIGNLSGELHAFHANGTPAWKRQINRAYGGFYASPVIGADGSIYAVSTTQYEDHRDGVDAQRVESYLHKFAPGGGLLFVAPFPEHFSGREKFRGRGATNAAPNLWFRDGEEAIIVPAVFMGPYGRDTRLIAFSTTGNVLADQRITYDPNEVIGGHGLNFPDWFVVCYSLTFYFPAPCMVAYYIGEGEFGFTPPGPAPPLSGAGWPLPNVAIWKDPRGVEQWIMAVDGNHATVAYNFSPAGGFIEQFRVIDTNRFAASAPVVLPDGHTVMGTDDGRLTYIGPNQAPIPGAANLGAVTAPPTRLNDGRLIVVGRPGYLSVVKDGVVQSSTQILGESIASAAASCTHVFVATTDEFVTYDASSLTPVTRVPWVGGGTSSPAIGPMGHVYAVASGVLFAFPPPEQQPLRPGQVTPTKCDNGGAHPGGPR